MDCTAFLVGSSNKESLSYKIARNVGFTSILPFNSLAEVEKQSVYTPICFFLFEEVSDISLLDDIIKRIRRCKRHNVRFFPLIYLCNTPSPVTIKQCITLGFDDVIAQPKNYTHAVERFNKQLNSTLIYYETDFFFGPDRRRIADINLSRNHVTRGVEACLQYKFNRDSIHGVSILSKVTQAA